jgi:tocopherol cyclase
MSLRSILNSGVYHGLNKIPPFFEGWYYKLINADELHKVAIIPGVFLGQDAHAFLQVLDGVDGTTAYPEFPVQDFRADDGRFAIEIGENRFDDSHLYLALNSPQCQLTGEIHLGSLNPWPVTCLSPGIMECYSGVLSFSHSLQGTLTLNSKVMDSSGGRLFGRSSESLCGLDEVGLGGVTPWYA